MKETTKEELKKNCHDAVSIIAMTVAETRKEYEPVIKTSSFGLSELRAKLPNENNKNT